MNPAFLSRLPPATAYGGLKDSDLRMEDLEGWQAHTNSRFGDQTVSPAIIFLFSPLRTRVWEQFLRSLNLPRRLRGHTEGFGG